MTQKIIKVGNSFVVTIPKNFVIEVGFKAGDKVEIESDKDLKLIIIKTSGSQVAVEITPEFKSWLKDFNKTNEKALRALAKL